jgi:hypothetical protein
MEQFSAAVSAGSDIQTLLLILPLLVLLCTTTYSLHRDQRNHPKTNQMTLLNILPKTLHKTLK